MVDLVVGGKEEEEGKMVVDINVLVKARVNGGLVNAAVNSTVLVSGFKCSVVVNGVVEEGSSVVVVVSSNAGSCVVEAMAVELEGPTVVQ